MKPKTWSRIQHYPKNAKHDSEVQQEDNGHKFDKDEHEKHDNEFETSIVDIIGMVLEMN